MPARRHLSMATALALVFGGTLLVTLGGVLAIVLGSSLTSTRELLDARVDLTLDSLGEHVGGYLRPVEEQLRLVQEMTERDELELPDIESLRLFMQGTLSSAPQLSGFALLFPDRRYYVALRGRPAEGPFAWPADRSMDLAFQSAMESDSIVWGEVVWSDQLQQPVLTARVALRTKGAVHAVLIGVVTLNAFREHVATVGKEFGLTVFVLEGKDRIVADSRLLPPAMKVGTGADVLPTLAEGGDPVLLATRSPTRALDLTEGLEVEVGGDDYAVFSREIEGFTRLPWSVGTYLPMSQAGAPVFRILRAGGLAVVLGLLGTALTAFLGYRLTRPVARLAQAANRVSALELAGTPPLPASSIREIDAASQAFNAMVAALRWFEVYVPKRLVRRLMSEDADGVVSRESVLTVMFTDIRGFSTMSQDMNAADAAALLNRHFELIERCVAASEGTLDKYLGDGALIFWGAPQPQPDHARRACDTALAIRVAVERDNALNQPPLAVRIGIHTGPVLVGNIGTRDRLDYTIVGDTVNVAQRLQELGKTLQPQADVAIILSGDTAIALGSETTLQPLGPQTIRGHTEPMEVYAL